MAGQQRAAVPVADDHVSAARGRDHALHAAAPRVVEAGRQLVVVLAARHHGHLGPGRGRHHRHLVQTLVEVAVLVYDGLHVEGVAEVVLHPDARVRTCLFLGDIFPPPTLFIRRHHPIDVNFLGMFRTYV